MPNGQLNGSIPISWLYCRTKEMDGSWTILLVRTFLSTERRTTVARLRKHSSRLNTVRFIGRPKGQVRPKPVHQSAGLFQRFEEVSEGPCRRPRSMEWTIIRCEYLMVFTPGGCLTLSSSTVQLNY